MDKRLNELWLSNKYPFNGYMYILDDLIPLSIMYDVINDLFDYFRNVYIKERLFLNHDWFEHDGYVNSSNEIQWNAIDYILQDEGAFYNSRDEDYQVRITIYTNNLHFIIRYNILDEDEDIEFYPGKWGSFELLCNSVHYMKVEEVFSRYRVKYLKIKASEYFAD